MQEPEITFAPLFSEEHEDRLLLLKFVVWPDDDLCYCYRLNRLGVWVEFDPDEPTEFPPEDMPKLVDMVDVEIVE